MNHFHDECGRAGANSSDLSIDSVFVRQDHLCCRIDVIAGQLSRTYEHSEKDGQTWGYATYSDGILLGSIADKFHLVLHRWR